MFTRRGVLAGSAATLMWPGAHAQADAQTQGGRYALVVGNDRYTDAIGPLRNAVNDARLVADALRACGFEIPDDALVINQGRDRLMAAARAHAARVAAAGENAVGFLYYAGHGVARADGRNYLIPIVGEDVDMTSLALWDSSISLDWLLGDALANVSGAQIVAIDACRNELRVPNRGAGGAGSFRSVRGIEVVSGQRANAFLSFATWEGQTAFDGSAAAGNGPYAAALAERLRLPGRVIELFDDVRIDVLERTQQIQEPMNLSRLSNASRGLELRVPTPGAYYSINYDRTPVNHALVIGCSYAADDARRLPTTHGDAGKLGEALAASNFRVQTLLDPDRDAMMQAIRDFADGLKARGAAIGVISFSGYGSSQAEHNYLLPEGPLPEGPPDLAQRGVSVEWIIRTLDEANVRAAAVLIDCGRQLPYLNAKAVEAGFAEQFGTQNVVLAYSTAPGTFVVDGPQGSRFAEALAVEIRSPERRHFEAMLMSVSERVAADTNGMMRPFFLSSAATPIFFRGDLS